MEESRDSFSPVVPVFDLSSRLRKIRLDANPSAENENKYFDYRTMIIEMSRQAVSNERDFLADIIRLLAVYYTKGSNNIERILFEWRDSEALKREFVKMSQIYGITSTNTPDGTVDDQNRVSPTLGRISDSVPHISLYVSSRIRYSPQLTLRPRVSDYDLGAEVSFYFKLNYYPGLIDSESSCIKTLAGFVLFNLCHTRAILNSKFAKEEAGRGKRMTADCAFTTSCKISKNKMENELAPPKSKKNFTKFIKTLPLSPELLNRVWQTVIGDAEILLTQATSVTRFHEKVLSEQPLNLQKWSSLMNGYDTEK